MNWERIFNIRARINLGTHMGIYSTLSTVDMKATSQIGFDLIIHFIYTYLSCLNP